MPQSKTVMAFRKRCRKHGYTDISVVKIQKNPIKYRITACEPLAKQTVIAEYEEQTLHFLFRKPLKGY